MNAKEIIRAIVDDSGKSAYRLSSEMGYGYNYVAAKISQGNPPNVATLAAICEATGHQIVIRNRTTGREIIIDPPEK